MFSFDIFKVFLILIEEGKFDREIGQIRLCNLPTQLESQKT